MLLIFTCEHCGKRFRVDERSQGKRGRCSYCGHKMRIPRVDAPEHAHTATPTATPEAAAEAPFRLSPPEPRPLIPELTPPAAAPPPAHHAAEPHHSVFHLEPDIADGHGPHSHENHVQFELLDDDTDLDAIAQVSPAVKRGLQEIAEFEKDPRGYKIEGDRSGVFSLFGVRDLGPASWLYTKWRSGVNLVLKLFRFIDTWAYLISVPFLMLMVFGILIEKRQFVQTGAVAVVLANYGRFWADLFAFFVRPYKDGPLHGLLFLFPPYTIYYLVTRWDGMKKIVRRIAMSCIPILLVIVMYGFLPSVNSDARNAQGIAAKLQAGKDELDRDIESDLNRLKNEVIGVVTPQEDRSKSPVKPQENASKPPVKRREDSSKPPF